MILSSDFSLFLYILRTQKINTKYNKYLIIYIYILEKIDLLKFLLYILLLLMDELDLPGNITIQVVKEQNSLEKQISFK